MNSHSARISRSCFVALLVCCSLPLIGSAGAKADELVAMMQIARSDGLMIFAVGGIYESQRECETSFQSFAEGFNESAGKSGLTIAVVTQTCAATVPKGSEFDALWNGAPTSHYILFSPTFRLLIEPKATDLQYERLFCETLLNQVPNQGQATARCDPPLSRRGQDWSAGSIASAGRE